ncbi:MAG: cation transporter [Clostridia bacterium]|nr:cation transporter [Clostridia bacterium]
MEKRNRIIVRTSLLGILSNIMLAGVKAVAGLLSASIAIILDAVNNLSDALSSVITIIGAKLAGRRPDKKHPLGHGRIEYISAMIVSAIVIYAGITAGVESVKGIIEPKEVSHTWVSLVVLGTAVVVKIALGLYFRKRGKQVNSTALVASGSDALFDAILSFSVLVSTVIFMGTGVSIEAYVGILIAAYIIKSGISLLQDTISDILGKRADPELSRAIKEVIMAEKDVRGVYDLVLNNYGPDRNYASVHLELPDVMTVEEVDVLTRRIQTAVYLKTGTILTGVGVYSYNTQNTEAANMRNRVQEAVMSYEWVLQMHGFFCDFEAKEMRFDVVLDFSMDPEKAKETLYGQIGGMYPDYKIHITMDVDISD